MENNKLKILEADYNIEKQLAKIKLVNLDSNEEMQWALIPESFDSLIAQITGKPLKYHDEQRQFLCQHITNIEFYNDVEIDIDNTDINEAKDKNITELQHYHDVIDSYPFYEIQQEIYEESHRGDKDEEGEN